MRWLPLLLLAGCCVNNGPQSVRREVYLDDQGRTVLRSVRDTVWCKQEVTMQVGTNKPYTYWTWDE